MVCTYVYVKIVGVYTMHHVCVCRVKSSMSLSLSPSQCMYEFARKCEQSHVQQVLKNLMSAIRIYIHIYIQI